MNTSSFVAGLSTLPYQLRYYVNTLFNSSTTRPYNELLDLCPHVDRHLLNSSILVHYFAEELVLGLNHSEKTLDMKRLDLEPIANCNQSDLDHNLVLRNSLGQKSKVEHGKLYYGYNPDYDASKPNTNILEELGFCKNDEAKLESISSKSKACKRTFKGTIPTLSPDNNPGEIHTKITKKDSGGFSYTEQKYLTNPSDSYPKLYSKTVIECTNRDSGLECNLIRKATNGWGFDVKVIEVNSTLFLSGSINNPSSNPNKLGDIYNSISHESPLKFSSTEGMMSYLSGESTIYHYALPLLGIIGLYVMYKGVEGLVNYTVKTLNSSKRIETRKQPSKQ